MRGPVCFAGTCGPCLCPEGMYLPCKDTWTIFVSCGGSPCPPGPASHTHMLWTQTLLHAPSLEHFCSPKSQEVCEPMSQLPNGVSDGGAGTRGALSQPGDARAVGCTPNQGALLSSMLSWTSSLWQFDGTHIVSGSLDTSIRVWDVESGNCLHTLMGHQSLTSGMELRDNILVSGNADSTVKIWDIKTGQCLQTLQGERRFLSLGGQWGVPSIRGLGRGSSLPWRGGREWGRLPALGAGLALSCQLCLDIVVGVPEEPGLGVSELPAVAGPISHSSRCPSCTWDSPVSPHRSQQAPERRHLPAVQLQVRGDQLG